MTDIPGMDGPASETTGPDGSTAEVADTSKEKNQLPRSSLKSSPVTNAHHDEPEQTGAYQEPDEDHDEREKRKLILVLKKIFLPVVLAVIGGVLAIFAIALYPTPSDLVSPSYPTLVLNSAFRIAHIEYGVFPAHPNSTKIVFQILLPQGVAHPPGDAATASLTLYLPPGTAFQACPTGFCGYYSAGPDRYWTKRLTFNPAPPSEGLGHTGESVVEISVKAHNFGYISNDVNAAATIPQLYYYGPGSPLFATEYIHVPSPNDYDWSAFAPELVSSTRVVWAEPSASGTVQGRVNVGINHAGQSRDSNRTFIAGALVGLAGAALLSAIVEAFHLLG